MDKQKRLIDRMNSPVTGIDLRGRESFATYTAQDVDLREQPPYHYSFTNVGTSTS